MSRGQGAPGVHETTTATGQMAESLAAQYLQQRGYRIAQRNYRTTQGEVDLIAFDGEVLCFVEVRSRRDLDHGHPLETIDRKKRQCIVAAARQYITTLPHPWPPMRFDAVGVVLSDPPDVMLVRGAFEDE